VSNRQQADRLGVTPSLISMIRNRRVWTHI
jgi:hypothetical protein